jgi:ADP-heptose:LPS heptosyltransferase
MNKYVWGGLGDFLLSIDEAKKEEVIDIYTHYEKAKEFFEEIGVKVDKVHVFKSMDDINNLDFQNRTKIKKTRFASYSMPYSWGDIAAELGRSDLSPFSSKPIVGIHPYRSVFGNQVWMEAGFEDQTFSKDLMVDLCKELDGVTKLIFGTKKEHEFYSDCDLRDSILVDLPIWKAFALSQGCHYMIGNDSAFKTFAASHRIPTTVVYGNYPDQYRDDVFIIPYCKSGVMRGIRYNTMGKHLVPHIMASMKS